MIVGIDEVGRGPWAGPLVFGAVVLGGVEVEGLTDSKKLTDTKRRALDPVIRDKALGIGLGWVSAHELDEIGMSAACTLACRRALEEITVPYHQIIIDGTVNFLKDTGKGPFVTTLKQADLLVPSVSAASIVAKVARDTYMAEQAAVYPNYGFEKHVGYGTAAHRVALQTLGVTPLHRKSFSPVARLLGGESGVAHVPRRSSSDGSVLTTRMVGNDSETVAAVFLEEMQWTVLARNWRKSQCEIDIVAAHQGILYFVEVKHRATDQQGGGLAAITPKKLDQMKFAARVYLHFHGQDDADWRLMVVTTTGTPPQITDSFVLDAEGTGRQGGYHI